MELILQQTLNLLDKENRQLGHLNIETHEDDLFIGQFTPGPDYVKIASIFEKFEMAVETQALSIVDDLDHEIAALGLCLSMPEQLTPLAIHDVQIWQDNRITFRTMLETFSRNGHHPVQSNLRPAMATLPLLEPLPPATPAANSHK